MYAYVDYADVNWPEMHEKVLVMCEKMLLVTPSTARTNNTFVVVIHEKMLFVTREKMLVMHDHKKSCKIMFSLVMPSNARKGF